MGTEVYSLVSSVGVLDVPGRGIRALIAELQVIYDSDSKEYMNFNLIFPLNGLRPFRIRTLDTQTSSERYLVQESLTISNKDTKFLDKSGTSIIFISCPI